MVLLGILVVEGNRWCFDPKEKSAKPFGSLIRIRSFEETNVDN